MRRVGVYLAGVAAFAAVWLGPLFDVLASPPHGGEGEAGPSRIKWLGDGRWGGPGEDGKTGFLIILLNFAALLWLLDKILFRGLRQRNAEASDAIRLELERATTARAEAEALVEEYETKLAALETEVADIRESARAAAEAEHQRIIAAANAQALAIEAAARRAAEREAARFRAALEQEIVDQAVARAEQAIRSSFGAADQRRLVDAWVEEVSASDIGQDATGAQG